MDLQEFRSMHLLNQHEAARLLGVPIGTYRNWEKGRREPSAPALRIAKYYSFLDMVAPELARQLLDL